MAERRMFAKTIIDSDAFLDMPMSSQALYFHLAMRADDDGFVNSPKRIQRLIGAADDDLKVLIAKQFVIAFENGIIVIKHWKMHNYIRTDRYKPTIYENEKSTLMLDNNGIYNETDTKCIPMTAETDTNGIPNVNQRYPQDRLGKDRLGKDKKKERKTSFDDAISAYTQNSELRTTIVDFIKMRKLIKAPMTDRALKGIFKELDKLGHSDEEKIAILEQSIERSWRGVFAISNPKQDKPDEKPKEEPKVYAHPFDDGSDPEYTRRCLEAQKRRGW